MKNIVTLGTCLFSVILLAQEISLFNGEDLSGWTKYGTEKWYVEDGLLVSESGPDAQYGYLATDAAYKDFELSLEFFQEADGNSGVFVRSTIEGTKVSGWQVEVAPKGKRGWLIQPEVEKELDLREGQWNTKKIRVMGDQLTSWLNGVQMVSINDAAIGAGEGSIALQIHDGGGIKVKWRNIKLILPE